MTPVKVCLIFGLLAAAAAADCGQGSVASASGACVSPVYIEGCFTYASSLACQQCEFNYVKSGNICLYSPPADTTGCCASYDSVTGSCSACANGLSLVSGKCQDRKIVGCLSKSATGTCINCASQYTLFGGQCFDNIAGCSQYSSTGTCQTCAPGFLLSGGLCLPSLGAASPTTCSSPWTTDSSGNCSIPGCQSYFDYGCARCQSGFKLLPDGSCTSGVIQGCAKYAADGTCQVCQSPLYTESMGFCMSDGCLQLNNLGKCTQCDSNSGYSLAGDGSCQITSCVVSSGGSCLVCQPGFAPSSSGCSQQIPIKYCTTCGKGFYATDDGSCAPVQTGCISYNGTRCTGCDTSYYLTSNYQCAVSEPGCIYSNGVCSSCNSPFSKSVTTGKCAIEGCTQYLVGRCQACSYPYILDSEGKCTYQNCKTVEKGVCTCCEDGYSIGTDGFCFQTVAFCKSYSIDKKCIDCNIGYFLDNSGPVAVCVDGKFGCNYVDGKCVSCRAPFSYQPDSMSCTIDGCLTYFLGGCQTCAASYQLRYNSCKLPNCLVSIQGQCSQCDPDYVMTDSGKCANKDDFCWTYDSNGVCTQCAPKYYMSKLQGKCLQKEPGCIYDDQDKCYSCDKPFHFDGVRCDIYGCLKLAQNGCDTCNYPMQVVNSTGLCMVVNCDNMVNASCVVCKPGFVLASDGSCKTQDPKCLVTTATGCSVCYKGYILDGNGACQYADEHCANFSSEGSCTNCDRLYFLNGFKKCEIRDSNCLAYSGGFCVQCQNYLFVYQGLCFPNTKGCLTQNDPKTCAVCESGYTMTSGICTPEITKLDWNSINMDFFSGDDANAQISQQVFTVGKTNKYNLDGAISKGNGKIIYSSVITGRSSFQVDDSSQANGWTPTGTGVNAYIGVVLQGVQVFYALDIKYITGSTMTQFAVQRSDDGVNFVSVSQFTVTNGAAGTVQTFYFTPVQALGMRIVVLQGVPNIKFEFYYSNGENVYANNNSTYIQQQTGMTILDGLKGQLFDASSSCQQDKELCWMGIQFCDATQILGFTLVPNPSSNGTINTVSVKYSQDGVQFSCYNNCNDLTLSNGSYMLSSPVTATKLRVYPGKYTGMPSYSIDFKY